MEKERVWLPPGRDTLPQPGCRIAIVSFTERGFALSVRMREALEGEFGSELPNLPLLTQQVRHEREKYGADGRRTFLFTARKSVALAHPEAEYTEDGLSVWCGSLFENHTADAIIFIGACGIAVRTIAPFLVSKASDPAVLVADENGKHIISLLSGHLGGGNELTAWLAEALGADPVITTASDTAGLPAIDMLAKRNRLAISDLEKAKLVAAEIVDGKQVLLSCSGRIEGEPPQGFILQEEYRSGTSANPAGTAFSGREVRISKYRIEVSPRTDFPDPEHVLHLVPRSLILGIGCKRGKSREEIWAFVSGVLQKEHLSPLAIGTIASIDRKADEAGILELAQYLGAEFVTFSAEELNAQPGEFASSEFVIQTIGTDNVCERAAVAALPWGEREHARFVCRKTAGGGITMALVEREWGMTFE